MFLEELRREECLDVLSRTRAARLAYVHADQPVIVPVYLTLDASEPETPWLYGITTRGAKIDWMRTNPRVCIEADEITEFDRWVSVVALGRYEELGDRPQPGPDATAPLRQPGLAIRGADPESPQDAAMRASARLKAYEVLQRNPMWWEPASSAWSSRPGRGQGDPYEPIYYRVSIEHVSGRRALPNPPAPG